MLISMEPVFFQQVQCPYCGEFIDLEVDSSAGEQSYIEDCQICCQPMHVSFDTDGEPSLGLAVDTAG